MTKKNRKRKTKDFDASNPCFECASDCCKYFAVYIDEPTDLDEVDAIKWYLHHKKVCVYIDREQDWYVHIDIPCKQLNRKGTCKIYRSRPNVCRGYKPEACERADVDVNNVAEFYSVEEFEKFVDRNYRVVGGDIKRKHRTFRAL